jgi:hypothetical protein
VDIVVLGAPRPSVEHSLPNLQADSAGAFLGGECESGRCACQMLSREAKARIPKRVTLA